MAGKNLLRIVVLASALATAAQSPVAAQSARTKAVVRADFPASATIEQKTFFFEEAELQWIADASHAPVNSRLYTVFIARQDKRVIGYATVPTLSVRTKPATLLIRLSPRGAVQQVRILTWLEAPRYRPDAAWLDQFRGASSDRLPYLGKDVQMGRSRRVGARTITQAVRRCLVIYKLRLSGAGINP
ncbi:MAG TPA: hypothetical protein VKA48_07430 [Gammaproteobacteria bacterium]|nr:hypothetical protein [Gammaproteobacteria bacterium]